MEQLFYKESLNDLKSFLTSGLLGRLKRNPTRDEVQKLLGDPTATHQQRNVVPDQMLQILYYDNLQITYIGEEFFQFAIYFREYTKVTISDNMPSVLGVDWYPIVKQLDYEKFNQFLLLENIPSRQVLSPYPTIDDGYTIEVVSTGIWVCFNGDPNRTIDSIFYTPSKPGQWQYVDIVF